MENLFQQSNTMFSIVVPTYNAQAHLDECIASVNQQNYDNYECIFVNDGSTDQSENIIKRYQNRNPRIRIISQANRGASAARNTGIEAAVGKYIVFLDADDKLYRDALSILADAFYNNPKCQVVWNFINTSENQDFQRKVVKGKDVLIGIVQGMVPYITPWMMTVSRDFLSKNHLLFENDLLSEDELFVPEVLAYAKEVYLLPEIIYFHREDEGETLSKRFQIKRVNHRIAIAYRLLSLAMRGNDSELTCILKARCAQLITGAIKESFFYRQEAAYKSLVKEINSALFMLKYGNGIRYKYLLCAEKVLGNTLTAYMLNKR